MFLKNHPKCVCTCRQKVRKYVRDRRNLIMKKCPFNNDACTPDCALFIAPADINEFVSNRLTSIGVFDRDNGMCSFKHKALAKSREVFEKSQQNKF